MCEEHNFWDRTSNNFDDFEVDFFLKKGIKPPDRILDATIMDPAARADFNGEYPFKSGQCKEISGCYLYYSLYDSNEVEQQLIPLYVGRCQNYGVRLAQHWNQPSGHIELFYDDLFDGKFIQEDVTIERHGSKHNPDAVGIVWLALWHEPDKRERMFLEHELIYKARPKYNKD